MLECKGCGVLFEKTNPRQKYCCTNCRIEFNNKKFSGFSKEWHKNNPERVMLRSAKHRAKRLGVPFSLELSDIVIPEYCPVLGLKLQCNANTGHAKNNSPSLDRIIPELGYMKGNIQVISNLANVMKHDASIEHLVKFATWVLETYNIEGEINV